jgi:hypothetical protein
MMNSPFNEGDDHRKEEEKELNLDFFVTKQTHPSFGKALFQKNKTVDKSSEQVSRETKDNTQTHFN